MRLNATKAEGKVSANEQEARDAIRTLGQFIGHSQMSAIRSGCRGEEKQFFFDKLVQLSALVQTMPKTYQTDGQGDAAIVHLHYFTSQFDWYITERDMESEQHQAFGLALLHELELGYISIVELLSVGAELDLYFKPCTLGEIKAKKNA